MLKNENGYPIANRSADEPVPTVGRAPEGCSENRDNDMGNMSYGESIRALNSSPLAYVYAPDQHFRLLYSAPEALTRGTLFEELYKPMEVYGNE